MAFPWDMASAGAALRDGTLTSVELLAQVRAMARPLEPDLGVFVAEFGDTADLAAEMADREVAAGIDRGPLHGIPLGIKDIFATVERPITANSVIDLDGWWAGRDAQVVRRLRDAGAVLVGATTTMEFAIGTPDPTKPFPMPKSAWGVDRWAGGSSSGSATGVAAGMFLGGLGSDTGGSVRIPAACNGVTGLKTTFGRVSTAGCYPLAESLDTVGPIARTAADCRVFFETLVDPPARTSGAGWSADRLGDVRIGVAFAEPTHPLTDPSVAPLFADVVEEFTRFVAGCRDVELPHFADGQAAAMIMLISEGYALHRERLRTSWDDYARGTRLVLGLGATLSAGDYVQARRVGSLLRELVGELFTEVDALIMPTMGRAAAPLAAIEVAPVNPIEAQSMNFLSYWNLLGYPALALPMGFNDDGLPLSFQIVGPPRSEDLLLTLGEQYQRQTDWHRAVPGRVLEVARGVGRA